MRETQSPSRIADAGDQGFVDFSNDSSPASFKGSELPWVQQASTGPAIVNGPSNLQRVQQSSTGPAGPITDQKGPTNPKTDPKPGKPDAGIALQGQITLVYFGVLVAGRPASLEMLPFRRKQICLKKN